MTPKEIEIAIGDLEKSLDRLHALYNQYFMGIEKMVPSIPRKAVDRKIYALRREKIRNTAQRFRFQSQVQKYNTQTTYWRRICRQIEEGTYKRHVMLAKRRQEARAQPEEEKPQDEISDIIDLQEQAVKERPKAYEINLDESDSFGLDDPFGSISNLPATPVNMMDSLDDPFSGSPEKKPTEKQEAPTPKKAESTVKKSASPPRRMTTPPRRMTTPPKRMTMPPKRATKRKNDGNSLPRPEIKPVEGIKDFFSNSTPPPPPSSRSSRSKRQQIKASSESAKSPPTKKAIAAKSAGTGDFDLKRAKKIYRTYVAARKKCNESTDKLTLEKVTKSLKKQHKAKDGNVDFKVVIRGGKAAIKAVKK